MSAFLSPTALPVQRFRSNWKTVCVRCALKPGGKIRRRRNEVSHRATSEILPSLSKQLLSEVRRLVRSCTFIEDVKDALGWTCIRFTGLMFERLPISEETADGIPEHLRELQERVDYRFIDVPPGIVQRAKEMSGYTRDISKLRLCAVFETYGENLDQVQEAEDELRKSKEDIEAQILEWSDVGASMRTETDLLNIRGPELFHESLIDWLD